MRLLLTMSLLLLMSCISHKSEYVESKTESYTKLEDGIRIQKYEDHDVTCRIVSSARTNGALGISCVPKGISQ